MANTFYYDRVVIFSAVDEIKQRLTFDSATRRSVLKVLGVGGATAGVSALAAGQETTTAQETTSQETTTAPDATPILLGGEAAHWFGLEPGPIRGKNNPALALQAGEKYRLVWMNLDGTEHELIIEDANGNELAATESASTPGATRSVVFTASEEMAEYYCEYHPQSMRGGVTLGSGFTTATETAGAGSATESGGNASGT